MHFCNVQSTSLSVRLCLTLVLLDITPKADSRPYIRLLHAQSSSVQACASARNKLYQRSVHLHLPNSPFTRQSCYTHSIAFFIPVTCACDLELTHVCVMCYRGAATQRPLFLAAPGVANAQSAYFSFSQFLHWSDQPIYVLDKDNDLNIAQLARQNASDIVKVQPEGPYLLGGHSYGGAVAMEVAMVLESWGHEIGAVLVRKPTPALLPHLWPPVLS